MRAEESGTPGSSRDPGQKIIASCNEIDLRLSGVVEASAGTGKTYTITGLAVRLVVGARVPFLGDGMYFYRCELEPLSLDQILMSTFTRAATEDMRRKVTEVLTAAGAGFTRILETARFLFMSGTTGDVASGDRAAPADPLTSLTLEGFLRLIREKAGQAAEPYMLDLALAVMSSAVSARHPEGDRSLAMNRELLDLMLQRLEEATGRLGDAVRQGDLAAVHTIHQFCQKVLRRYAFESGALFRTTLVSDLEPNQSRADADVRRQFLYGMPAERRAGDYYLYRSLNGKAVQEFLSHAAEIRENPVLNSAGKPDFMTRQEFEDFYCACDDLYQEIRKLFPWYEEHLVPDLPEAMDILVKVDKEEDGKLSSDDAKKVKDGGWLLTVYNTIMQALGKKKAYKGMLRDYAASKRFNLAGWSARVQKLFQGDPDRISQEQAKPIERFKDYVLYWQLKYALRKDVFTGIHLSLRQELSFDDLIHQLARALERGDAAAERLADSIRRAWPVAVLDEFQDTSSDQYAIFRKVYLEDPRGASRLLIIGDPKQAIYSFRGADVDTYIYARGRICGQGAAHAVSGARYTLARNFRSSPDVINSVNALFANPVQNGTEVSVFDGRQDIPASDTISFVPSQPGGGDRDFLIHGFSGRPGDLTGELQEDRDCQRLPGLLYTHSPKGSIMGTAAGQVRYLLGHCLIASRLRGDPPREGTLPLSLKARDGVRYALRPLLPGDVAVLVRSGRNGKHVVQDLARSGIRAVLLSDKGSVTARRAEMNFLGHFLESASAPGDPRALKGLLTCPLLLKSLREAEECISSSLRFSAFAMLLRECGRIWERDCFLAAFCHFIASPLVMLPERLSLRDDGQRLLTNVMHLAEIIQKKSLELPSPRAVVSWFADTLRTCGDPEGDKEEDQDAVRLETASRVVRVVTVHSSKGLEYPVVVYPDVGYVRDERGSKPQSYQYHDPNNSPAGLTPPRRVLRLSPDMQKPEEAREEERNEAIRLLYVGLTRAVCLNWICLVDQAGGSKKNAGKNSTKDETAVKECGALEQVLRRAGAPGRCAGEESGAGQDKVPLADQLKDQMQGQGDLIQEIPGEVFSGEDGAAGSYGAGDSGETGMPPSGSDGALLPESEAGEPRSAVFSGWIDRTWRITSYSSLCRGHHAAAAAAAAGLRDDDSVLGEGPDPAEDAGAGAAGTGSAGSADAPGTEAAGAGTAGATATVGTDPGAGTAGAGAGTADQGYRLDRFHFPHGSASGTFLHHLLEVVPFPDPGATPEEARLYRQDLELRLQDEIAASYFADSATLEKWRGPEGIRCLADWFIQITTTPLAFGDRIFSLAEVPTGDRLAEADFTFSLGTFRMDALLSFLEELGHRGLWLPVPGPGETPSRTVTGFLSGVIDLFFVHEGKFYVADYKSNFITMEPQGYDDNGMARKIMENRYDIQYAIYTLAAWRFLRNRIPGFDFQRDFGGIMYLFLRGLPDSVPPGRGAATGAFFRSFAGAGLGNGFIEALNDIFAREEGRK